MSAKNSVSVRNDIVAQQDKITKSLGNITLEGVDKLEKEVINVLVTVPSTYHKFGANSSTWPS